MLDGIRTDRVSTIITKSTSSSNCDLQNNDKEESSSIHVKSRENINGFIQQQPSGLELHDDLRLPNLDSQVMPPNVPEIDNNSFLVTSSAEKRENDKVALHRDVNAFDEFNI